MLSLIYRALNVRKEEENKVALMLGHGFFMGVFFATFTATADTVFLNTLGGAYINQGIFAAGALGVVTTGLFAFMQSNVAYRTLTIINLISIFVLTSILYYFLKNPPEGYYSVVVFVAFAMQGPITAVFLLGFWGVFGRMFDLRQSKRIIGGIDTGQLTAAIIAFALIGSFQLEQVENYLLFSAGAILASLIFLLAIGTKYNLEVVRGQDREQATMGFKEFFGNRYILLLSVFLALSVAAYLFIERTYLTVLQIQYEGQEQELLRFIAWFGGSILVFSFLFQTFFNDRIIANYGLKVSLLILPVVLSVFVVGTILIGLVLGYEKGSEYFVYFFLCVALSKLFITFLRDAMENPAYKLYFMPLDLKIRFDVQAKVEGVVNETAKAIAGALILGLGFLAFFNSIAYYFILAAIIVGWVFVTGKLYTEYRNKIKLKLETDGQNKELSKVDMILQDLEGDLIQGEPEKAIFSYKLIEKLTPGSVSQGLSSMMKNPHDKARDFAQKRIDEMRGLSVSDKYVVVVANDEIAKDKELLSKEEKQTLFQTADISKKRIATLCRSDSSDDRQYAAELIGNSKNPDALSYLIDLLGDMIPLVRISAIKSAEKKHNPEILNALISNLSDPAYEDIAMNSLVVIGKEALDSLEFSFQRTGQKYYVMRRIIMVMGRIGGPKAKQMLWNKIDFPDKVLASQALISLGQAGFRADLSQITRVKYAIESDIEDIAWNIAAYNEVPATEDGQVLKEAIQEENIHDSEHIYTLLSMLYDASSIQLVKDSIESGTSEGVTYAIELLDVFLSEDLKQKVIPVLDDIPDSEKLKKLEIFFPRAPLGPSEVVKLLINREFNQTNRWTKTCAIALIGKMKIAEYTYDLIANLFNPDRMVCEVAAWSLHQIDPAVYAEHVARLDDVNRRYLDMVVLKNSKGGQNSIKTLLYEKVMFLKQMEIFADVPGFTLSSLVNITEEFSMVEGESYSLAGENRGNFYVVFDGVVNNYAKGKIVQKFESGDFIGELFEKDQDVFNGNQLVAEKSSIVWRIPKDQFYSLLSDNLNVARKVMKQLRVA